MIGENFLCIGAVHELALGDMLVTPLFRTKNGDPSRIFVQRASGDYVTAFDEVALDSDDLIIWTNGGRELAVGDRPLSGFWSKDDGLAIGNRLQMIGHLSQYVSQLDDDRPLLRRRLVRFLTEQTHDVLHDLEDAGTGSAAHPLWRPIREAAEYDVHPSQDESVAADVSAVAPPEPAPEASGPGPVTGLPLDTILMGDSVATMRALPANSVDMIFADPPYDIRPFDERVRSIGPHVGSGDDRSGTDAFAGYDRFTRAWLQEARRVLKDDGTIWVIGSYHNIFRVGAAIQDLGYWILNDVVWRKSNPMPNMRGTRFTNAHETLIWAATGEKAKYTFNYRSMKTLNDELQMRSDWEFPVVGTGERVRLQSDKSLTTQKPEALIYRLLLACTKPGDVVLDPFFGTGTVGAVAKRLGRRWIGIERDRELIEAAQIRISAAMPIDERDLTAMKAPGAQPKVSFGVLVENGLIAPGSELIDAKKRFRATVRVDGSIMTDQGAGSIHRMGALLQNAPSCNGWSFWHIASQGKLVPISELRDRYLLANMP